MGSREDSEAIDRSIIGWKWRHRDGYFGKHRLHQGFPVYDHLPECLVRGMGCVSGDLFPVEAALELGCGYGAWMREVAPYCGFLTGIDIDPGAISEGIPESNTEFRVYDGKWIPFEDGTLDLVYSVSVFQHLPRVLVKALWKESVRVLCPGGVFIFQIRDAAGKSWVKDIGPTRSEQSVGWTKEEILEAWESLDLPERQSIQVLHDPERLSWIGVVEN